MKREGKKIRHEGRRAKSLRMGDSNEGTKDKLVSAAQHLFALRGFDSVTVKELSQLAGVNPALISYHFGDKKGLYRSCLERIGKKRLAHAERVLHRPSSMDDVRLCLRLFIEEMIGSYLEDPSSMLLVHRECDSQTIHSEDIFSEVFIAVFQRLRQFLSDSRDAGLFKPDIDVHVATIIFFGMIVNLTKTDSINEKYFKVSLRDNGFRNKVIESLMLIFLNGVAAKKAVARQA